MVRFKGKNQKKKHLKRRQCWLKIITSSFRHCLKIDNAYYENL